MEDKVIFNAYINKDGKIRCGFDTRDATIAQMGEIQMWWDLIKHRYTSRVIGGLVEGKEEEL